MFKILFVRIKIVIVIVKKKLSTFLILWGSLTRLEVTPLRDYLCKDSKKNNYGRPENPMLATKKVICTISLANGLRTSRRDVRIEPGDGSPSNDAVSFRTELHQRGRPRWGCVPPGRAQQRRRKGRPRRGPQGWVRPESGLRHL